MRHPIKKTLTTTVAALSLCAGVLLTTTHAEDTATTTPELKIKKVLTLPDSGVHTPEASYTFTFEKVSKNNKEGEKDKLPDITAQTVSYTAADKIDQDDTTDGKQLIKLTPDALKNVSFSDAGQYTYRVKETTGDDQYTDYSKASYLVSIFTKTDASGKFVVDTIQIAQEKNDKDETQELKKTEYTPGTGEIGKSNNFVFTNVYDKTSDPVTPGGGETTPTDEEKKGFVLTKTIKAGTVNDTERFIFAVTVTAPTSSHKADTKFKATIVDAKGQAQATTEVAYGKSTDFTLQHGYRLVLSEMLLGSTVKADETTDGGYLKSIGENSVMNGVNVEKVELLAGGIVAGEDGDGSNIVNFINTQQTPTGILLNNLPFIILAVLAGLGILFFVKNRHYEEEEA